MRVAPVATQLLGPLVVDLRADRTPPSTCGRRRRRSTCPWCRCARRLDDLDAAERADDLPRREVDVVVAAEVAGVVVHDPLVEPGAGHVELPGLDQLLEELAVVDDLVVAAELRVLVQQRVEAVRALRDDLLHAHAVRASRCSAWRASGRCTRCPSGGRGRRCTFSDGPRMAKSMPARCSSLAIACGDLLVLVVEATRRSRPSRGTRARAATSRRRSRCPSSFVGPVGPLALAHAPRVAAVLHRPVGVAELGREVRLHQRQVAPHVEDLVEDLDVDRADLVARLARRAGPDLLGGDALEQRVGRRR